MFSLTYVEFFSGPAGIFLLLGLVIASLIPALAFVERGYPDRHRRDQDRQNEVREDLFQLANNLMEQLRVETYTSRSLRLLIADTRWMAHRVKSLKNPPRGLETAVRALCALVEALQWHLPPDEQANGWEQEREQFAERAFLVAERVRALLLM